MLSMHGVPLHTEIDSPEHSRLTRAMRPWAVAVFIAVAFYAAVAPTLSWTQFHDPIENLNVATALEMRHGGPWLVPNLQGFPRLAKPPLTAWLTAISIRPETVTALSATDPAERAHAYARFTYEVRRPALLAAALMLIAAYWLGHLCSGPRAGVYTACLCATEWLLLRQAVLASTDIQLALWVATANAFLALCVLHQRRWVGSLGAGAAMGFVFMAKGPVGLVQTLLPLAAFAILLPRLRTRSAGERIAWSRWVLPVLAGAVVAIVVGGWWYAWVAAHHREMGKFWFSEVSRIDADNVPAARWYKHFLSLYLFLPWLVWLAMGAVMAIATVLAVTRRARDEKQTAITNWPGITSAVLGACLLIIPLVLMSFAKDRFQRYLVPLCPAAALLAAGALIAATADRARTRWLAAAHWVLIGLIAVGLPIVMALGHGKSMQTVGGGPLISGIASATIAIAAAATIGIGIAAYARWRDALVIATTIVMLGVQIVYFYGYGKTSGGRCELSGVADGIAITRPDTRIYVLRGAGRNIISVYGNELSIYLNRPVNFVPTPADVPVESHPQIMLVTRGKREPELATPPGWSTLARLTGGSSKYVFIRLPGEAAAPSK